MAEQTNIEWCDSTFNPFIGCTKVGPGCDNCYAENLMDHRMHKVVWGPKGKRVRTSVSNWRKPLAWDAAHAEFFAQHGRRQRVFCASLADVFDNAVPHQWRADLFDLILRTPNLDWLLLTKRIGNVKAMLPVTVNKFSDVYPNVWIGATICNQEEADRDIPKLLAVPAHKRFLSMEPLLSDVRLGSWLQRSPSAAFSAGRITADMPDWTRIGSTAIDWVIVGGESGPGARPMHPDWARGLRDQCNAADTPFFFKQWGNWAPAESISDDNDRTYPERWMRRDGTPVLDGSVDFFGGDEALYRLGKKSAGRLLDGRTWDEVPA